MDFFCVAILLSCIAFSLWTRRHTFHHFWEKDFTTAILMQGLGVLLILMQSYDDPLDELIGVHSLDNWLGHMAFVGALSALILHMQTRLVSIDALRSLYRRDVGYVLTLTPTVTLALLWESPAANTGDRDLLDVKPDAWLDAYWITYSVVFVYLLSYLGVQLLRLRVDDRSRRVSNLCLLFVGIGAISCVIHIVAILAGADYVFGATTVHVGTCLAGSLMALVGAYSWRQKTADIAWDGGKPYTEPRWRRFITTPRRGFEVD